MIWPFHWQTCLARLSVASVGNYNVISMVEWIVTAKIFEEAEVFFLSENTTGENSWPTIICWWNVKLYAKVFYYNSRITVRCNAAIFRENINSGDLEITDEWRAYQAPMNKFEEFPTNVPNTPCSRWHK